MGNAAISTRKFLEGDPFKKDREFFISKCKGPHNQAILDESDYLNCSYKLNCYTSLMNKNHCSFKRIFVGFAKDKIDDDSIYWADFVVNRSLVKDAFLTKDVEEGLLYGFELDLDRTRFLVDSGLTMLRLGFEYDFNFKFYKDLGFTDEESFALAVNLVIKDEDGVKYIDRRCHGFNHFLITPCSPFKNFSGEGLSRSIEDDDNTYKSKNSKTSFPIQNSWGCIYPTYAKVKEISTFLEKLPEQIKIVKIDPWEGDVIKHLPKLNDSNLKEILNHLKEIK